MSDLPNLCIAKLAEVFLEGNIYIEMPLTPPLKYLRRVRMSDSNSELLEKLDGLIMNETLDLSLDEVEFIGSVSNTGNFFPMMKREREQALALIEKYTKGN